MRHLLGLPPASPTVHVLRLQGAIGAQGRGLSEAGLAQAIDKAFARKPKAVALQINSPGGSPAQSALIGSRIRRLADEKKVPVLAFVEDVAASGGYWLASVADEIFVDASSIVGSIGVISAGFGLHEFIRNHGVERRVHTAGKSKSQLDPFRPEDPEDVARLRRILDQVHETFIAHVKERRGDRLADDPAIFTGEIWVGAEAVKMGLADAVGHMMPVLRERYGKKVRVRSATPRRRSLLSRLGAEALSGAVDAIEERAAYARFGL